MEFLRSLLRRRFARAQVATSRNVGCFLGLILELSLLRVQTMKMTSYVTQSWLWTWTLSLSFIYTNLHPKFTLLKQVCCACFECSSAAILDSMNLPDKTFQHFMTSFL